MRVCRGNNVKWYPLSPRSRAHAGEKDLDSLREFHVSVTPKALPIIYVPAPAAQPMASMRKPPSQALRPVKSDKTAPTTNKATQVSAMDIVSACWPLVNRKGSSGTIAPADDRHPFNPARVDPLSAVATSVQ